MKPERKVSVDYNLYLYSQLFELGVNSPIFPNLRRLYRGTV